MAGSASTCPAILPNQTPSLLPGEAREIVQTLTGDTAKTTGEAGGTSPRLSNSSSPTGTLSDHRPAISAAAFPSLVPHPSCFLTSDPGGWMATIDTSHRL